MASNESKSFEGARIGKIVQASSILSGIGSFGTLLLTLSGVVAGLGGSIIVFQGFAFGTVLIAAILYYELVRDKWPGREDHYLNIDLLTGSVDPEFIPEEMIRLNIVTLEKRERLAISEDKMELAASYRRKIEEWKKTLKKRG